MPVKKISNTVVVPAYKEAPNIRPLTERLFKSLADYDLSSSTELLIVDDNSKDGSVEEVAKLQKEGFSIRIIVRTNERGLSSAVLRGFKEAAGDRLICMDGDLQHPPEKVPLLIQALGEKEYVVGTRYGKGFDVDPSWPWYRVIISNGARMLARPLTPLSDPMSGFFGLTRTALARGLPDVNPVGFKIALELYVKARCSHHAEVSIFFGKREAGESKLTGKVMIYYLVHLEQLYHFRFPWLLRALAALLLFLLLLLAYALLLPASPARLKPKGH